MCSGPSASSGPATGLESLDWWGRQGSNLRPRDYESPALTTELLPLVWCIGLHLGGACQHPSGRPVDRSQLGARWSSEIARSS